MEDEISELVSEMQFDACESTSKLIAVVINSNGQKFQAHIFVTKDENDFIDNEDKVLNFKISDGDLTIIQ